MADSDKSEIQQLIEQNKALAATVRDLHAKLVDVEARIPAPPSEPDDPNAFREFPRAVFKHHGGKPGQIDHVEHDAKTVATQAELDAHLEAGWTTEPEYPEGHERHIAKKKSAKK